ARLSLKVLELYLGRDEQISKELRILAQGRNEVVTRYKGFIINGLRFHIKDFERNRKIHNSSLVNFKRLTHHEEAFVLASQVQQVFYTEDIGGWHVAIKTTARDAFDMNAVLSEDDVETYLQSEPIMPKNMIKIRMLVGLGRAQMHKKREKHLEGSQDLPSEDDILAQVVGKEKYGRVRMYGLDYYDGTTSLYSNQLKIEL
ncbi:hypothetical protein RJ639_004579, partial [Escallonia herrerae]